MNTKKTRRQQETETKASGIQVSTQTIVTISTTDGLPIRRGDLILLKIRDEDILCTFLGLNAGGYFVTESAVNPKTENKYRTGSIEACYKVAAFELEGQKAEPADAPAAEPADQQTLSEA